MTNERFSLFGSNAGYLEELYQLYKTDPTVVDPAWRSFFERAGFNGVSNGSTNGGGPSASVVHEGLASEPRARFDESHLVQETTRAFRKCGHRAARLSPVIAGGVVQESYLEFLHDELGRTLDQDALSSSVDCEVLGKTCKKFSDIVEKLAEVYCSTVGFEVEHLTSKREREWLYAQIESPERFKGVREPSNQIEIYNRLAQGDLLEAELHRKYVGAKRFSLEGTETLIPVLSSLLEVSAESGVREVVFGMAHRGRLSVLVNILGKPLTSLFLEFEDRTKTTITGAGDVKYHMGFKGTFECSKGSVEMSLLPNPSHLEYVNPVVEGVVRAKQDRDSTADRKAVMPVLMHGDAAFAGQGVVFECLNFAGVEGYTTGGTVHIVINNQIGFTTTPEESRSTRYCTDLAKGLDIPVFHVNAEDPEAACWSIQLAVAYRNHFGKDVLVDLIGFRKYGHNEGDDPSFTQPLMYAELKGREPLWRRYGKSLMERGVLTDTDFSQTVDKYKAHFDEKYDLIKEVEVFTTNAPNPDVAIEKVQTAVPVEQLQDIAKLLVNFPDDFTPHPKLARILEKRSQAVFEGIGIEWGMAEALAFGSLVEAGVPVRLSGQDCRRGTFSHRHLVLDDHNTFRCWSPLGERSKELANGSRFEIHNSTLSEAGVLGFEFGYAAEEQRGLNLWEAQFGDFANGAQGIIDQFISSSEMKWGQLSGVVLLLPHGYEGQGPEHSSARLERFLQLCAQRNMSVCYPSNAKQYYHLLRRQGLLQEKRPLVIMTPKSLLRLPQATSTLPELASGAFERIIVDELVRSKTSKVLPTLICTTGKVYYDFVEALREQGASNYQVVRIEELYPFPDKALRACFEQSGASSVIWVQEEHKNQGPWNFIEPRLRDLLQVPVTYCGREESASTATGSGKYHAKEQREIVERLLALLSAS
jgi:2-oxoglutarate dehydrogenase E1 component